METSILGIVKDNELTPGRPVMKDYHINVFHSQEDDGYIADIPDLRYCSPFGSTPAEAMTELEKDKSPWIEAALTEDKPFPKPRYRPAIYQHGQM
jgi:predicted RNase H-like HicB family nuclease